MEGSDEAADCSGMSEELRTGSALRRRRVCTGPPAPESAGRRENQSSQDERHRTHTSSHADSRSSACTPSPTPSSLQQEHTACDRHAGSSDGGAPTHPEGSIPTPTPAPIHPEIPMPAPTADPTHSEGSMPTPTGAPIHREHSMSTRTAAAAASSAELRGEDEHQQRLGCPPASADGGTLSAEPLVAAVDVGTTSVRCVILDGGLRTRGACRRAVSLLYPQPDRVEMDPDQLFGAVCEVIGGAVADAGITADQLTTLGMSVLRSSFVHWNCETGRHYHNIVMWSDRRAARLVAEYNRSWRLWALNAGSRLLYTVTGRTRFLAGSVLRFMNQQVTLRLLWCMRHVPGLRADLAAGRALFGTVETYLLYRLTDGRLHVSDVTSAAATGFFDPYLMQWSGIPPWLVGAPARRSLPRVVPNTYQFGRTAAGVLAAQVPIGCVIGDQSGALVGAGCLRRGDVAVTLGTGSFMDVNTGDAPHTSVRGVYPCIGWQRRGRPPVYMAEGSAGDTANCVLWGRNIGLYPTVGQTAALAASVRDSGGVRFVPAFSGLAAPVNDPRAAAGFIGVTAATSAAQLTLALLQAVVFRLRQLHSCLLAEAAFPLRHVRIGGGVANNDLVCQMTADLLDVRVERDGDVETSARGAAVLAGLEAGVWRDYQQLERLRHVDRVFEPDPGRRDLLRSELSDWERAVQRCCGWYAEDVQ